MVIDRLEYLELYAPLHPRFTAAFSFLRRLLAENAPDGRHVLEATDIPEEIFVNLTTGSATPQETACAESHKKYIDVQVVLSGEELMYVPAAAPAVVEENSEKDFLLYAPAPLSACTRLDIPSGSFAIFFAGELHAPCHTAAPCAVPVRKAIVKVLA